MAGAPAKSVKTDDPAAFRRSIYIDADGKRLLGECMDDWQRRDFEALDAGWKKVCGFKVGDCLQRGYLERPRGHSKSGDLAVMATWALWASKRRLSGVAAAGDREQANLLKTAIEKLLGLNPWLKRHIEVQRGRVINKQTGSTLDIIASDAATSYGLTPDFVLVDELTHWTSRDLWDSLISAAAKRSHCLVCVIANAGFLDSWQWQTKESDGTVKPGPCQIIRRDPDWYFSRLEGPVASWISQKQLDEQKRILTELVYNRLWGNIWAKGSGTAIRESDIEKALNQGVTGKLTAPEIGWAYALGLDIGLRRDASALALVGVNVGYSDFIAAPEPEPVDPTLEMLWDLGLLDRYGSHLSFTPRNLASAAPNVVKQYHPGSGRLKLCDLRIWQPPKGGKVLIEPIEDAILELFDLFGCTVGYDVSQAEYLSERLSKAGVPTRAIDPKSDNMRGMASATLEAFSEHLIALYAHEQLLADLRALRIEERSYGVRLTSPRGPTGHGDSANALSLALLACKWLVLSSARNLNRPLLAEAVCF